MRVVIVGGGAAGNSAAWAIRKASPSTRVTIVSAEAEHFYSPCGIARVAGRLCDEEDVVIRTVDESTRAGIEVILGAPALSVDPRAGKVDLVDGSLGYDVLILATGSKVRLPACAGIGQAGVFTLKTLNDARLLRDWQGRDAVVVGSGPVGVETAVALRRRGMSVTLVEMQSSILPEALDPDLGADAQRALEAGGISVRTGCRLERLEGNGWVRVALTSEGAIACDTAVMANGMVPNTDLAAAAGIELGRGGGVVVDERQRTSLPGILACGDCTEARDALTGSVGPMMFWVNARRQGHVCGLTAAGVEASYRGSVRIAALDLFGVTVLSVGQRAAQAGTAQAGTAQAKVAGGDTDDTPEYSTLRFRARTAVRGGKAIGIQYVGSANREYGRLITRLAGGLPLPLADPTGDRVRRGHDSMIPRTDLTPFSGWIGRGSSRLTGSRRDARNCPPTPE